MAYDDKFLKRDGSGKTPVPQHFNPTVNDYEPLYGRNNASRVELYGPDGNPISTANNKLAVRAAELEALIGEVQESPTANTLLARIKSLETELTAIKSTAGIKKITDALPAGGNVIGKISIDQTTPGVTNAVQLTGSNVEQAPDSAAPTKATMVGGKYSVADPTLDDGDLGAVRINSKGELMFVITNSDIALPVDLQYNQLTEAEALPVKTTGRKVQVRVINSTSATTVNAGQSENIYVTPTAGYKGRVLGIMLACTAPTGAASGNHYFKIFNGTTFAPIRFVATYNKNILFDYCEKGADTTASPSDANVLYKAIGNLYFTETVPLRVAYTNGSNVNQTNSRQIYVFVEEEAII